MEDYRKKYERDLEAARDWLEIANEKNNGFAVEILVKLFPELKESEDEQIRKAIIKCVKNYGPAGDPQLHKKMLTWLEKQGEQKFVWSEEDEKLLNSALWHVKNSCGNSGKNSGEFEVYNWLKSLKDRILLQPKQAEYKLADKSEPKFKVGDWIVRENKETKQIGKIKDLPGNHYQYWTTDGRWFGDATEARLWTIKDAKDGDVLANGDMILIFKEFELLFKELEMPAYKWHIIAYAGLDCYGHIQVTNSHWALDSGKVKPATKEQCDLFFQKMEEAGYEWDDNNKELRKIKQSMC